MMTHFKSEFWLDLVRGTAPADRAMEMRRHLGEGCTACSGAFSSWKGVAELMRKERDYEPPADVVRVVKSWQRPPLGEAQIPAILAFDSLRTAAIPGIRSIANAPRQLLYRAGSLCIDLQIESPADGAASVVGQVMDSRLAGQASKPFRVWLAREKQFLQDTVTTESGEFQFELESTDGVELCIAPSPDREIRISLEVTDRQPDTQN
jgi:hypothetical protein